MRSNLRILITTMLFAFSTHAFTPDVQLEDRAQEAMAHSLFQQLRCVVCEGQSLAESDATLARQMRDEVRRMVKDGQSEADITAFFQQRYGDTILMSPPLKPRTYLLWAMPVVLLIIGALVMRRKA